MIDKEKAFNFFRKRSVLLILLAALIVICLIFVFIVRPYSKIEESAIPLEDFFFPDEPLQLPDIQLSREPKPFWSDEEAARWFIPLSENDLNDLRLKGEEKVKRLLEAIP